MISLAETLNGLTQRKAEVDKILWQRRILRLDDEYKRLHTLKEDINRQINEIKGMDSKDYHSMGGMYC